MLCARMADKRRQKRYARRLRARFGEGDLSKTGFVIDVSLTGLFITANQLPAIGTRLHVEVEMAPQKSVFLEAQVMRHKSVPLAMRSVEQSGFGVRFLDIREVVAEMLPALKAELLPPDVRFTVRYATLADVQAAFERELSHGGLFVATEQLLPRETSVMITLELGFCGQTFQFRAKVVQVSGGTSNPGAVRGLGFLFDDKVAVITAIASYAG